MISLSNDKALDKLRHHPKFDMFMKQLPLNKYPGINKEQIFYFVSTGALVADMNLDSTICLMRDIKVWISKHSHGGIRDNAGRRKSSIDFAKITFTAERPKIEKAKIIAKKKHKKSLQALFRDWLEGVVKN